MRTGFIYTLLLVVTGLLAQGNGFILYEVGNTGTGNASAGASALALDASAVYTNPASITELKKDYFTAGVVLIPLSIKTSLRSAPSGYGTLDQSGGGLSTSIGLYWAHKLNEKFSLGFAINAPAAIALDYDDAWVGRYVLTEENLAVVNIEPVMAYRLNDMWSFGLGLNLYLSMLDANMRVPTTEAGELVYDYTTDGYVNIDGTEAAVGITAGVHFRPCELMRLGLTYRMGNSLKYDGDVTLSGLPTSDLNVSRPLRAELPIVNGINFGLARRMCDFDLLVDASWSHWRKYSEMPLTVQLEGNYDGLEEFSVASERDWDNTWRVGIGGNYYLTNWTLQCGVSFDSSPTNAESQSVDAPSFAVFRYAAGVVYNHNDKFDFGLQYSLADGLEGDTFVHESAYGDLIGHYTRFILQAINFSFSYKY